MKKQREFLDKFYKRCSHSYEMPTMTDRGIQIILNSTVVSIAFIIIHLSYLNSDECFNKLFSSGQRK